MGSNGVVVHARTRKGKRGGDLANDGHEVHEDVGHGRLQDHEDVTAQLALLGERVQEVVEGAAEPEPSRASKG